jgi:hypothetical protein
MFRLKRRREASIIISLVLSTLIAPSSIEARDKPTTKHGRNIPGAGSATMGVWVTKSSNAAGGSTTRISMPTGSGTALLADWNGDGIATAGKYDNGMWSTTNTAVGKGVWEKTWNFGGEVDDIPITADRDADGNADLAVFRNGIWTWHFGSGESFTEEFGQAGDIPIVGDWNGDGRIQLGVVRSGVWLLNLVGAKSKPQYLGKKIEFNPTDGNSGAIAQFSFGLPTDTPVVGDWDGDGTDEPGVVRGSTWFLSKSLSKYFRTSREKLTREDNQIPLVGQQVSAQKGCPTSTRAAEKSGVANSKLVERPITPRGTRKISGNQEILASLTDGLRYSVRTTRAIRLKSRVSMEYSDPLSTAKTTEEAIRRNANTALAAGIYLSSTNGRGIRGLSKAQLIAFTRWQIRSIACQHTSNTPGGWGDTWQSALWAVTTGQAAWLIWPELNLSERSLVANMVVAEADNAAQRGPRYFRDRLGQELTAGDSLSDEVSWDLMAPALALSMMPKHDHARIWRESTIALAIAAFARPGDLTNDRTVNGINVNLRLPGTNANEDGTVTNHGIVNPDYTQNVQHLWWAATMLRASGASVPEALFFNADIVYRALSVVVFDSPPYASPGGTVYAPEGQIYYPMGVSWGVRRPATFVGVDGFANVYAAPDTSASNFLAAHAYDVRALQLRFSDGHMYAPGTIEDSYRLGKEEYALQQIALAWWAGSWKAGKAMTIDTKAYPEVRLDRGYELP